MAPSGPRRRGRFTVNFDPEVWAEEVERFEDRSPMWAAAGRARAVIEASGVERDQLRGCSARGDDGTRLGRCVKVYVPLGDRPPSERPLALVCELAVVDGEVGLRFLAFGERHPRPGTRSVYERAHKRLHGRYQDEQQPR